MYKDEEKKDVFLLRKI